MELFEYDAGRGAEAEVGDAGMHGWDGTVGGRGTGYRGAAAIAIPIVLDIIEEARQDDTKSALCLEVTDGWSYSVD